MRRMFGCLVLGVALVGGSVGAAKADTGLPDIRHHRHFIVTPTGALVEVGPRVCDDPALQDAFNQFHYNIHHGIPGVTNPAAPGLDHEHDNPVALTGGRC